MIWSVAKFFLNCLLLFRGKLFILTNWAPKHLNIANNDAVDFEINFNFYKFDAAYWAK